MFIKRTDLNNSTRLLDSTHLEQVRHTCWVYEFVLQGTIHSQNQDMAAQRLLISARLTVTFFCVTTQTESLPRTAMLVMPAALTALNAYSVAHK